MTNAAATLQQPFHHPNAVKHFLAHFGLVPRTPDLTFLERILSHFSSLPYENISKILKLNRHFLSVDRIRLPEEVMEEYARHHLGGTCFSLSYFLQSILLQMGYTSYIVMANMGPRENVHCALAVQLNGVKYLADPGYLLTQAMELHPDRTRLYRSPHTGVEVKFNRSLACYQLYTFDHQTIKLRYTFTDRPTPIEEFMEHWLASFYQGTMHGICLTQLRQDGLIYVHDNYLQMATAQGKRKRRLHDDYYRVVAELFAIEPELIERAQLAMAENMELEQVHGLFRPKTVSPAKAGEVK